LNENRVSYIATADYTANSDLDKIIKATIDKIAAVESIVKFS
jgi:hypothetical protein